MTGMSHHITTLCRLSLIGLLYLSLQVAPVANALPSEDVGVEIDLLAYDGPAGEFLFVAALLDDVAGVPVAATAGAQTLQVLFPVGVSPSDNLTIVFQVPAGGDFRVDTIRTFIPEPPTTLLAGLGLAGLALAGRKR